jgi:uncharacterized membrane protein YgcG
VGVGSAVPEDQIGASPRPDQVVGTRGAARGGLLVAVCAVVGLAAAYDIRTATRSTHHVSRSQPAAAAAKGTNLTPVTVAKLAPAQQAPAINLRPKRHVVHHAAPAAAATAVAPTTTTASVAPTTTSSSAATFTPAPVSSSPPPQTSTPVSQSGGGGSQSGSGKSSVSGTKTTSSSTPAGTGVSSGGG